MVQDGGNAADTGHRPWNEDKYHLCHDDIKQDHNRILCQGGNIPNFHKACANPISTQPKDEYNAQIDRKQCGALKTGE